MKTENTNLPKILKKLKELYPSPACALHYKKPWELLVAVILSAQCTDKKVNEVTKVLFKKYKTLDDYIKAEPAEFEQDIRATGFYHAKAKNILAAVKVLKNNFESADSESPDSRPGRNLGRKLILPKTIGEMIAIPGVGRKTANVVLGELYGISEGIAVDTHVTRLAQLFGLTKNTDATKIEQDLMKTVPKKDWVTFPLMLILYGREYCKASCKHTDCPLQKYIKE